MSQVCSELSYIPSNTHEPANVSFVNSLESRVQWFCRDSFSLLRPLQKHLKLKPRYVSALAAWVSPNRPKKPWLILCKEQDTSSNDNSLASVFPHTIGRFRWITRTEHGAQLCGRTLYLSLADVYSKGEPTNLLPASDEIHSVVKGCVCCSRWYDSTRRYQTRRSLRPYTAKATCIHRRDIDDRRKWVRKSFPFSNAEQFLFRLLLCEIPL